LLSASIWALSSPLGPHPERNLATDLYYVSTSIAVIDEFDRQINFSNLKKYVTSLSMTIGALGSPLGPHLERDLATDLYSDSTLIAIKTSPITKLILDDFKKATTSLQEVVKA
jgi:hypothetical protein